MKLYDITRALGNVTVNWPGDICFKKEQTSDITKKDKYNSFKLTMSSHSGTHIDSSYHFLNNFNTIDQIPIENMIINAKVIQISSDDIINKSEFLDVNIKENDAVLFKTKNQYIPRDKFHPEFIPLDFETAEYLVEKKVSLIGIDYLSIERDNDEIYPIHKIILKNNIIILEDIDLFQIVPGEYKLYCFPMKISGSDAAPCRAILEEYNN